MLIFSKRISDFTMRNVIFGVCNGKYFARLWIFTMRNSFFDFQWYKIEKLAKKRGLNAR